MSSDNGQEPTDNAAGRDVGGSGGSEASMRAGLAQLLGNSIYEERDYWDVFDWQRSVTANDYLSMHFRNPFAKTVNSRPAFTTWRDDPQVYDEEGKESAFAEDVERLNRELDIWSHAERLDRNAGIGRYGVAVMVTTDVDETDDLQTEFDPATTTADGLDVVTQIKTFNEASIENVEFGGVSEASEGRWGLPTYFDIDFGGEANSSDLGRDDAVYRVHHSRVITAPATRLLDDDFYGRPRTEPVWNILKDIEKTMGAVAEMAYRGAEKGIALEYDPEQVQFDGDFLEDQADEMQRWQHGLQWYMRTVGNVQQLGGDIAPLQNIFEPHMTALAVGTQIPRRIFEGDPAGALAAAEEDTQAYFGMIDERRTEYVTPHYIRNGFIGWFTENDLITPPSGQVITEWEQPRLLTPLEESQIAERVVQSLPEAITVGEARELFDLAADPDIPGLNPEVLLSEIQTEPDDLGTMMNMEMNQMERRATEQAKTEAWLEGDDD